MTTILTDTPKLRLQLAERLSVCGYLRTAPWREAVLAVPREHFLYPGVFIQHDQPAQDSAWVPVLAESTGPEQWAQMAYEDITWVTQLDGMTGPADVQSGAWITGTPTSSSTLPSLVVGTWEDLQVESGMRIGEIGTGTGYSTALGCARSGSQNVVSVEVDAGVATQAAAALHACGYDPMLIVGDGLAGFAGRDGFDRIVATCSVTRIPAPWLAAAKPGALIMAPISSFGHSGLVRLAVTGPGRARGEFLPGTTSFIAARGQPDCAAGFRVPAMTSAARAVEVDLASIQGWPGRFVAGMAAGPTARWTWLHDPRNVPITLVILDNFFSWAVVDVETGTVDQGGPGRLWDQIERTLTGWRDAGSPPQHEFQLIIEDNSQMVTHPGMGQSWALPES